MIFDQIENFKNYFGHLNGFNTIFKTLKSINVDTPDGNYKINDRCYYKVMTYDTQINPSIIESHKNEVDLQVLLSGKERINIYDKESVEIKEDYNPKTDCQFYRDIKVPDLKLDLTPGKMAIFFPQDIHGCQHAIEKKTETIKKIVIKINEKFFTR